MPSIALSVVLESSGSLGITFGLFETFGAILALITVDPRTTFL